MVRFGVMDFFSYNQPLDLALTINFFLAHESKNNASSSVSSNTKFSPEHFTSSSKSNGSDYQYQHDDYIADYIAALRKKLGHLGMKEIQRLVLRKLAERYKKLKKKGNGKV